MAPWLPKEIIVQDAVRDDLGSERDDIFSFAIDVLRKHEQASRSRSASSAFLC